MIKTLVWIGGFKTFTGSSVFVPLFLLFRLSFFLLAEYHCTHHPYFLPLPSKIWRGSRYHWPSQAPTEASGGGRTRTPVGLPRSTPRWACACAHALVHRPSTPHCHSPLGLAPLVRGGAQSLQQADHRLAAWRRESSGQGLAGQRVRQRHRLLRGRRRVPCGAAQRVRPPHQLDTARLRRGRPQLGDKCECRRLGGLDCRRYNKAVGV